MARKSLTETLTADGNTSELVWPGGEGTFTAYGTFGTGTASLQVSFDAGSTFFAVGSSTDLTTDGLGNFDLPQGAILRGNLSSSTNPDLAFEIHQRKV